MTQNELALASGMEQSTISKLLKGKRTNPGMDLVIALAKALRVSLDWLVLGQTSKDPPLLPPDEDALLASYRNAANDDMREIILTTARDLSRASNK